MNGKLKISPARKQIVMDRAFAKEAFDTRTEEYAHLQAVRRDYPYFAVVRRRIKRNANKECYDGLTYAYIENYIRTHETDKALDDRIAEYQEMRLISECHSKSRRYPTIKKWFLERYPEVRDFGKKKSESDTATQTETEYEVCMPPLQQEPLQPAADPAA